MNNSRLIFTLLLVMCVKFSQNLSITSILSMGDYHINVLKTITCDPMKNNKIQINLYLDKTSTTSPEFKGNITIDTIIFDDSLHLHGILIDRDYKGRWASSKLEVKKEKACTTFKSFINPNYYSAFGWNGTCPVLPGTYISTGIPATNIEKVFANFPKIAPYGTYRFRFDVVNKKNEYVGCSHVLIEIKRPRREP